MARIFDNSLNQYVECQTRLRIVVKTRNHYFNTQELALKFASNYHKKYGVFLGVEEVPHKTKKSK